LLHLKQEMSNKIIYVLTALAQRLKDSTKDCTYASMKISYVVMAPTQPLWPSAAIEMTASQLQKMSWSG